MFPEPDVAQRIWYTRVVGAGVCLCGTERGGIMRGTIGLATRAFAAAALAVLVMPAACSPVQWDFVFVEDIPDPGDAPPYMVITAGDLDLPGGFTFAYPMGAQTGVEEGAELYLTSLSFWIFAGSPEADFSSFTSITVEIELQSVGTPVVIASLPSGDPQFQVGVTTINLVPELVNLADYVDAAHTITVTVTGAGPAADLWFAGKAIFSGTKSL